jgi:tuftelin-interacting protein 11
MGRRKQQYLDDDSSDSDRPNNDSDGYNSQEDADARTERVLFERNARKRRRMGGKESAWEGVFGEDDGEGEGGRPARGNAAFKCVLYLGLEPVLTSRIGRPTL